MLAGPTISAVLFTSALDELGIPWARPSRYAIAIYRNAATAPRRIRRTQIVSGTFNRCPLPGVAGPR